jgi:hypothetical protein
MRKHVKTMSGNRPPDTVVSFYLPERQALGGVDPLTLDPDRDWAIFGTGVYVWILQTFLRLHKAGAPVRLVQSPPAAGLVVAHAGNVERLLSEAASLTDTTIVVARSDRGPQPLADFVVVQNAASADRDHFFIPSWLQPGLIQRHPARATRVENVAYVGAVKELDPDLASLAWAEALRRRGLSWDSRTIAFSGNDQRYQQLRWNDYENIDIVVALRPPSSWNARSKPAAKLQNAWAAGVPAILSPEDPYRELRNSRLDYLEARSADDVLDAIETLRSNPGLYSDMVQNGLERAREFSPERLVSRWMDVLWREIPERDTRIHRLMTKAYRCRAAFDAVRRRRGSTDRQTWRRGPIAPRGLGLLDRLSNTPGK